ncbi:MAG: sugar ABC transporter substrate-binding protein [Streptosporangiaceae bacterium]
MVAAGCSSTPSSSGSSQNSSASASASAPAGVAAAQALINKYLGNPVFTSPGSSFDASKAAGKTLFSLPANSGVPFVETVDQVMGTYAKALGLKYVDYPNQQQQSQWVQGMNQAISGKANAIDLNSGIPPEQLKPQIIAAKSAGIPTVDTNERDRTQTSPSYVAAYTYAPFQLAGQLMAAWAVAQTKGKADVLVITSNADVSSMAVQNGITSVMTETCPGCKMKLVNVNPVDWATDIPTTVEGAISGDPGINYILPVYDSMAPFAATGVVTAGKSGQIHIATYNGTPSILDQLRTGNVIAMDVGENTSDVAAAGLDQALRVMLGMKPGNEVITPKVIDKQNVGEVGVPAVSGEGYGDAFADGYAKTWGVSPSVLTG